MTANLSLQVIPINQTNAYPVIDVALQLIKDSGIKHMVGPFQTSLEGELEELMQLVEQIRVACFDAGAHELIFNMQLHLQKDKDVHFEDKIEKWQ